MSTSSQESLIAAAPPNRPVTPVLLARKGNSPPRLSKRRQIKSAGDVPRFPLAYIHYRGDRHLHPERLPSAKREPPVSLRLLDFNKTSMANVALIAGSLKRLSARGLKVHTLPEKFIDNLSRLEQLDFSANRLHDYGIPDNLHGLSNLIELRLNYNKLTHVPNCLKSLTNLHRLDLSHNKIDSLKGIDKSKRLKILVLDHNLLTSIFPDIASLKKLEILHCANNSVREIERDVRHLKCLKDIDLSCNKIGSLPGEIILLPSLETLNVNRNKISKLGVFNLKIHNRHWLQSIDLSENVLSKLPEQLLMMTYNLDVSHNRIKVITGSVLKKLDWRTKQTVNLKNNPITHPPQDVCESGISSMVQFFLEAKLESKVHEGVKMIVLGEHGCGKTSLVQSVLDQQPRMENDASTSAGINSYEISFENGSDTSELHTTVWDFCGHSFYNFPHYIFNGHPSITLIAFDIARYRSEHFYDNIGSWVDWVITKDNRLAAILVGTKSDLLDDTLTKQTLDKVQTDLATFLKYRRCHLERLVKRIESRPYISSALSEQLKSFVNVLKAQIIVYPAIISTSSKLYSGIQDLKLAIGDVAKNAQFFPHVGRIVPTFWLDVQQFLEDKGNSMYVPVMKWSDYEHDITSRFGMKHILVDITTYLHETGKIIWFRDITSLKDLVFIRPLWLFDVFRNLIRHDVNETVIYSQEENFLYAGYLENRFLTAKTEFVTQGVCEIDFAKALLGSTVPIELQQPFLHTVRLLVDNFNLAIPVNLNNFGNGYTFQSESKNDSPKTRLLFPCYRKSIEPITVVGEFDSLVGLNRLIAEYIFPYYYPPGTFDILCARLCKSKHNIAIKEHWKHGIYGHHSVYAFDILTVLSKRHSSNKPSLQEHADKSQSSYNRSDEISENATGQCIRVHLKWTSSQQKVTGNTVWSVFLPILNEIEDILSRFSGLSVSRHMICPFCGEPSFVGEWLSPKETQNLSIKPCEACNKLVDTSLLVPPRQKKRDDIMKRLAELQATANEKKTERAQSSHETKRQHSASTALDCHVSRSLSNLT